MGGAVQDEKHKEEDERGEEHLDEEEEETYGKQWGRGASVGGVAQE